MYCATMETIKPSTPTPHHLRRHNLSFFDRLEAPKYMNTIVYFSSNPSKTRSHISNTLKKSLADILSVYYPLAGRIADNNMYVDCHDQGIHYREINVKGSLILSELDPSELYKFLPYDMDVTCKCIIRVTVTCGASKFLRMRRGCHRLTYVS